MTIINESPEFLQQLIDTIPNPIFYKDVKGEYKFCNKAFVEYLGIKKEDIINHTAYDICPKELADIYTKADLELFEMKGKQYYETKVKYNDGSFHDVHFIKAVMSDGKGDVDGFVGIMIDITERKKAEKKMNSLLKLKEAMLEINHAMVKIVNINELFDLILEKAICSIDNANTGCILVLDEDSHLRMIASRGLLHEKLKGFFIKMEDYFIKGDTFETTIINDIQKFNHRDFVHVLQDKNGCNIESTISAPIIINEQLFGFLNVSSPYNNIFDDTDIELLEYLRHQIEMTISKHILYEEAIYLSRYDKLTNIYNRSYFEELLNESIKKAIIYSEGFLLVEFDLNGLKRVNDTYGHLAGDELIKTFVNNLKSIIRSSDIFARIGGDEFVGVFFNSDKESLTSKFEELISYFKDNPIIFQENKFICSFSYGFAFLPKDGVSYSQLLTVADKDMYGYKEKFYKNQT